MIHRAATTLLVLALMALAACSGGDADSSDRKEGERATATASSSDSSGGGSSSNGSGASSESSDAASDDPLTLEDWVPQFCMAYDVWLNRTTVSDGIDPTTLELAARAERANGAAEEATEASEDFLDVLDDLEPPAVMRDYQDVIYDRIQFVVWDMEEYVDNPAETLDDIENLSIEFQVRTEHVRNSAVAFVERDLSPRNALAYTTALDANPTCRAVPRPSIDG